LFYLFLEFLAAFAVDVALSAENAMDQRPITVSLVMMDFFTSTIDVFVLVPMVTMLSYQRKNVFRVHQIAGLVKKIERHVLLVETILNSIGIPKSVFPIA